LAAPRLIITSGEPAGIGPDLCLALARRSWPCELIVAGDLQVLQERARLLNAPCRLVPWRSDRAAAAESGTLAVLHMAARAAVQPGKLDPANASYVLALLDAAADGCLHGEFDAVVTAPVQKSVINEAGIAFSGHTEHFAARTGGAHPVMMLVSGDLRVALATTHLPLREVSAAITRELLHRVLRILDHDLRLRFDLARPRILVCGLNPHAGESGCLGREEIEVIAPALAELRAAGLHLTGPAPADTAFTPHMLAQCDAVLAMYHDQGLPVIKYAGFSTAVNVTLGLPIIRTSVDHGTALELAGSGAADPGSLCAAIDLAIELTRRRRSSGESALRR
jgi:4-hydroxythreonine-4-phosphate dehydrogenase